MTEECNNFVMEEAMNNLGDAFDYVVYDYNMDLDEFMDMFIVLQESMSIKMLHMY